MARPERPARYGRYLGGPDPLAPPLDLGEALDAVSEGVMSGYSPKQALREFLRRGGREQLGLDDLSGRVQQRRRELLRRHQLGGTLDEVSKLLDKALLAERSQLARDARMDPTDRTLREMTIENLPESTAGKVAGLAEYDWASSDAHETYKQIQDLLGREALESRFAGMKRALENAGESEREAVTEMLEDLNELLEHHARGEDTDEEFADFMSRYGDYFPENPNDVDELIDVLAQRSAAAQRMLQSMSEEQRNELMNLSAQAFGSADIQNQLSALDENLRRLRPDEDWDGAEEFTGDDQVGYGEGTSVMAELGELDALSDQLGDWSSESPLSELDIDALERHLGREAAVSARTLADLEKSMQNSGYLRRNAEGDLRLSPAAMRKLGKSLLRDAATRLSGRTGTRDTRSSGAAGEQTGASRPWQFGDTESWNVPRTISNAITRTAGEGGDPREGLRLAPSDIEVSETEARTQAAVVLLVDTSFSMVMEGRWVPMKRTALALHHLVSTRFRGDDLELISFGRYAQRVEIGELLERDIEYEQGTNLHHALLLAGQYFRKHPTMQPVLLVVTDGEPTAHLEPGGEPWFSYPPARETIAATVAELDKIARFGAQVTFFRLGENPGLARFLDAMARRVSGTVVAPDLDDLGAAVVGEFLSSRFGTDFGDID
ncbi:MAG TPA: VWA domain-containing protein [Dietzia timorensis]|uniref:VWA domain-containing protein n=1 Tax=Dietzia timorensis TaxID=499555 RepID=A0A921JX43_9ACTN|nr:VWA domain-containing protein [Dietzia timorensis]HJE89779.1 VWA domain-containing protein [Dietzia timorensis]